MSSWVLQLLQQLFSSARRHCRAHGQHRQSPHSYITSFLVVGVTDIMMFGLKFMHMCTKDRNVQHVKSLRLKNKKLNITKFYFFIHKVCVCVRFVIKTYHIMLALKVALAKDKSVTFYIKMFSTL